MITEQEGKRTLYLLEMYNGKDTIRTLQQLGKHGQAIAHGSPGKTFGIKANPIVLSAFEHDSMKQAVVKRLIDNDRFRSLSSLYFFATMEDVKRDCGCAWKTVGEKALVWR